MARGTRRLTYADLDRRSLQVEALIRGAWSRSGGHVAVVMDNRPEFLEVAWGAQRAGTYWTPVNWHLTEEEAAYVVGDCGTRVLFAAEPTAALAARIAERTPAVVATYGDGQAEGELLSYATARDAASAREPDEEVEGTYFFYSSGTTGTPKGIKPKHAFPPFGSGLAIDSVMASSFGFGPDAVYLCPAPLYHAAPIGWSRHAAQRRNRRAHGEVRPAGVPAGHRGVPGHARAVRAGALRPHA
jgi:long-chain acyl-CoA synthetase